MDFSNLPPFTVDKVICNEPCGVLGRRNWDRGAEVKCKNEIWQLSLLFFSKTFLDKERNVEKSFIFLYLSLKEKTYKILSRLCPFSVEFHFSISINGAKECHPYQWRIAFELGWVHFLYLLCGLEGLHFLALWVQSRRFLYLIPKVLLERFFSCSLLIRCCLVVR